MKQVLLILFISLLASPLYAQVGANPATVTPWNYYGHWIYATPQSVATPHDGLTTYSKSIMGSTEGIDFFGFNFTIPVNATINNIQITFTRFKTGRSNAFDAAMLLLSEGAMMNSDGTVEPVACSIGPSLHKNDFWPATTTDAFYTMPGSGSYVTGPKNDRKTVYYQWTPEMINNRFFGLNFSGRVERKGSGAAFHIDRVLITVNYTDTDGITKMQTQTREEHNELAIKVLGNPAASQFKIYTVTQSTLPIQINIKDVLGRLVEAKSGMTPNSLIQFGIAYKPGVYYLEIIQGQKRRTAKLVKQ